MKPKKPLGRKAYGSIPHLPGSRQTHHRKAKGCAGVPGQDYAISAGQARILTEQARDGRDRIYVTEKLDGSNVAIAKIDGRIVALSRSGYPASASPWACHWQFDAWVNYDWDRWDWLPDQHQISGEWIGMAHGTIYDLTDREPFVVFDIWDMRGDERKRLPMNDMLRLSVQHDFSTAPIREQAVPTSIESALDWLGDAGYYGAQESAEGLVWRCERDGKFDFIAKYVRPDKQDGKYLPSVSGEDPIWLYEDFVPDKIL